MLAQFDVSKVPPYYILFLLGVGILIWTVGRMRKPKMGKKQRTDGSIQLPAAAVPSSPDLRAMANELHQLIAELHDTSRRIAAQIDNRVTKLEILLQEADAKIATLKRLSPPTDSVALPAATAQARGVPSDLASGPVAGASASNDSAAPRTSHPPDPRQQSVYALADQGHTPREIAQQIGAAPGEVELILNLRPRP